MIKKKYVTCIEAAGIIGVSRRHVLRLIAQKKLKGEKLANVWFVTVSSLSNFIQLRKSKEGNTNESDDQ